MNPKYILRLIRHGKTEKQDVPDPHRQLSQEGQNQALRASKAMEDDPITLCLVSPTARTKATADIILGGHNECADIREFPEIYPDPGLPENDTTWKMFRAVGNKPLADYSTHPDYHLLEAIGIASAEAIAELVEEIDEDNPLILLVGHAVLNPIVAYAIAVGCGDEKAVSEIERIDMQEGETLELIVFEDDNRVEVKVIHLPTAVAVAH
ncbi:MAG TPA: histidine phosphatase family protein [Candidatus Paceibacterota bacterium]